MPKMSRFDLSHTRTYTCDMGYLVPSCLIEVMPNDRFKISQDQLLRLSPLLAPVLHECMVLNDWFFVPNRILQSDWQNFITHGQTGTDATAPPVMTAPASTGYTQGSLADYLGLPIGIPDYTHSAFPHRAYALIYNEYYRDQNLQSKVLMSLGNGSDTTTQVALLQRCWEKDYFTSALATTQRGSNVLLPLGSSAPITRVSNATSWDTYITGTNTKVSGPSPLGAAGTDGHLYEQSASNGVSLDPDGGLIADLSTATAASVNDIRAAFQLQKWRELTMRTGNRLVEMLKGFFGAYLPDYTAQRPQLIGRNYNTVLFSEVLQTSEQNTTPQGNMAGHGIMAQQSNTMRFHACEHGYIMCITTILPRTQYCQGIPRMFLRDTYLDYPWPQFANLGEQAVYKDEIYAATASPRGVFGYQPRYQEFRVIENSVHGQFKYDPQLSPTPGAPLGYWHMSRFFANEPTFNSNFVTADCRKDMFAVTDEPVCYMMQRNNVYAIRPIPREGIPGFIDH